MATPEDAQVTAATNILFCLPAELRNYIYEDVLEYEKAALEGDNHDAVFEDRYHDIDWTSLEKIDIPGLFDIDKAIQQETRGLREDFLHRLRDYLPAFSLDGDHYQWTVFNKALVYFGRHILPRVRWFLMEVNQTRILFFLKGDEDEFKVVTKETIWSGRRKKCLGLAVTHHRGHRVGDDYVLAYVEHAAEDIFTELESLVLGPARRLTARRLKKLVKFCLNKFKDYEDESDFELDEEDDNEQGEIAD